MLGEAKGRANLGAGDGFVELAFSVRLPDGVDPASATLLLDDATLYTGETAEWTDFWPSEKRIEIRTP